MEAELQTHVAFHLTGRRPAAGLDAVDTLDLIPALFARYRDLTLLRYDFPLVLVRKPEPGACVQPLCGLFDRVLAEVAARRPGCEFLALGHEMMDVSAMASDGFHPGPPIYALWAREAARRIMQEKERSR